MNKIEAKHRDKAKQSFETKLNLYIFSKIWNGDLHKINIDDFVEFKIYKDLVDIYTTVYYQYEFEYEIFNNLSIKQVCEQIASIRILHNDDFEQFKQDYISNQFEKIFPFDDFEILLNSTECAYCQVSLDIINDLADKKQLKNKRENRGWGFEIDRIDSNFEYKKDNCVMACYWCNNAKTDEFTPEEFIPIGNAIKKIWKDRLNNHRD